MNKLLILFLLFQTSSSFAQTEVFQDLVNHTVIHYNSKDIEMDNPSLDLLEEATYIELKDDQWPGAKKINALIRNQVNDLNTTKFAERFQREYQKALKITLVDWYNECVEESDDPKDNDCGTYSDFAQYFSPDEVYAEFLVTALCDHVLIGGMNISFTAAREQEELSLEGLAFMDLHYYDLVTGVEIDPGTILNKKKLSEFHKLIKSRVPKHLKQMADTLDFNRGLPVFNGASFYYFVEGNIEISTEYQSVLQIRLSLEEVIPFLNPEGPFKAYSTIKTGNTAYSGLMSDNYSGIHGFEEVEYFRSIERLEDHLSGKSYANKTVYIRPEKSTNETQIVFNKLGQPVSRKVIITKTSDSDDSVAYEYHTNGKLKSKKIYELEDVREDQEEYVLIKSLVFDQQQNLIEESEYKVIPYDSIEIEVSTGYYSYIDDRIIKDDSYEIRFAMGYEWGATEYLIAEGTSLLFQDCDLEPNEEKYSSRHSGDTTFIEFTSSKGKEIYAYYIKKNNQIIELVEQGGRLQTKIIYDKSSRPVQYSLFKSSDTGFTAYITSSMEYNSNNQLMKYTSQFLNGGKNPNAPEVYLFRYE